MRNKKIWLGVGAFVVAGSGAAIGGYTGTVDRAVELRAIDQALLNDTKCDTAIPQPVSAAYQVMAMSHPPAAPAVGEAGEGGENGAAAQLPPDLGFALQIALMRGHLLVGDELVKQDEWNAAFPHFLHPVEELYGNIRGQLKTYKTPPFSTALKELSDRVKAKKGGDDYQKALKTVMVALDAADAGVKAKQKDWPHFVVENAIEVLKVATGEYAQAITDGRFTKPVEYQDARGFVWHAERMIESIAAALEKKDADALKQVRADFADLKKAWPAAMPPEKPILDHSAVLGEVSRIELHSGKFM
ncbi:MAG: hypothetical protein JWN71_3703 [Xanthobacteraceae bacterium]|nr:hypothetical protein [Xanthobacteraceae bacterium]